MKIFNKKFAFITLLGLHVTMPVQAKITIEDITTPILATGASAIGIYILTTHLIKEECLVKSKYPHAQAWYDAMAIKYPVAHLDNKLFLQTIWGIPKNFISWCSTFNQIYFPQSALIRINSLYGMLENNQTLSDQDQLFLAEQEFILLHEAGHIEHNDITETYCYTAALGAVIGGFADKEICTNYDPKFNVQIKPKPQITIQSNLIENNDVSFTIPTKYNVTITMTESLIKTAASALVISLLLGRHNERNADAFAYTHGDDNALLGGISFFESEMVDPLFNIENKQPSPYLATDSTIGTIAQSAISIIEMPTFYIGKTIGTIINSTSFTRWLYDASRDLVHPGAPTRVQAIREEIQRRLHAQSK